MVSELRSKHKGHLNVFGGCCGTSVEHVRAIADCIKMSPPGS
jgi:methionine synthase I (cobalamin-dependent)